MSVAQLRNKTLKLDCFVSKVWTSRHMKCMASPYSRCYFTKKCTNTKIYGVQRLRLMLDKL